MRTARDVTILLLAIVLVACTPGPADLPGRSAEPTDLPGGDAEPPALPTETAEPVIPPGMSVAELAPSEIREYEGEDLSSIEDFHENSISGPQVVPLDGYELMINGLVEEPLALTYDRVLDREHYSKVVTLDCVDGWSVKILWEGVLLADLLDEAGVERGADVVIFYAADGYSSSLPLDYIRENDILLAHRMNGVTLPAERGFPFQVVAESKWGYKWVKWVTAIELSDKPYFGYWESQGYHNDADPDGPVFSR